MTHFQRLHVTVDPVSQKVSKQPFWILHKTLENPLHLDTLPVPKSTCREQQLAAQTARI